jgi:lipopolysaccharide/colanic/teichoic acid biosynthesis glycosyltransferase
MARRAFDVLVAGTALLVASPFLLAAVVAIRLESRGSAIYRQRRVGKDGRAFDVLKLRTMVTGAEHMGAGLAVSEGDTRITRVGRLLRRTSLDEVPNLVNVLRGDMSIVGPRPTVPIQVDRYTERQRGRLTVKPGITGWAQVNGRTELPWDERIELDLWYIEHRSWRLDLRILSATKATASRTRSTATTRRRAAHSCSSTGCCSHRRCTARWRGRWPSAATASSRSTSSGTAAPTARST